MQRTPHAPQFETLVARSTQVPAQSVMPTGHVQLPPLHCFPPLQTTPQPPQLVGSVDGSTHTPLQAMVGDWQEVTQLPSTHS